MGKTELHIEYVPVDDLKPYDKNARKHGDFDVDAIAESIKKFGFNDPIGVWGKDNLIVEGHGKLLASKKLGMKKVPIIHLDHLSDEQRRAYALAHNKTAENSEWDMEMLAEELESLNGEGFDMGSFGFDAEKEAEEREAGVDDIPMTLAVAVEFGNDEASAQEFFERMKEEGRECRILTL